MANPTTNRPTRPVWDNALRANVRAFVDCGYGAPIDRKSRLVSAPHDGAQKRQPGPFPATDATGFTHTPDGGSPCSRWGGGFQSAVLTAVGFPTTAGNTRTIAAVFRVDIDCGQPASPVDLAVVNNGSREGGSTSGIGVRWLGGVLTLGWYGNNVSGLTLSAITLTKGAWYAVAWSTDETGGSGSFKRKLQVYNYATQTLSTAYEVTNSSTAITPPASPANDLTLGADIVSGSAHYGFVGSIACCQLTDHATDEYWDATKFQAFYEDPWAAIRGTYSASGALTAPTGGRFVSGDGDCRLVFSCATGTGTGGTGSPTYSLVKYDYPDDAVGGGTVVQSGITPSAGGESVLAVDSTLAAGAYGWYRLRCVDGSDTVYFPASGSSPLIGYRRTSTGLGLLFVGDSHVEGNQVVPTVFQVSDRLDRATAFMNHGVSGQKASGFTNGVNSRIQIGVTGTPTSGQFIMTLILNGGSLANFTIPYNATASDIKTILEGTGSTTAGIGGSGNVTATGGPLPGTPVVVDFDGPTSSKKGVATLSTGSSTLNNGATPSATIIWRGTSATAVFQTAVAQALARQTQEGVPYYLFYQVGTNDANTPDFVPAVDFGRYLQSAFAYVIAQGLAGVVFSLAPVIRATSGGRSSGLLTSTQSLRLQQDYFAQALALDNGATIRYIGPGSWNYSARAVLTSTDGLHQTGNGLDAEKRAWANGIALAIGTTVTPGIVQSGVVYYIDGVGRTGTYSVPGGSSSFSLIG